MKEESDFWVYNQRIVLDENYEAGDAYISSEKYETMIGFHVYEDDILITTRGTIGKYLEFHIYISRGYCIPVLLDSG